MGYSLNKDTAVAYTHQLESWALYQAGGWLWALFTGAVDVNRGLFNVGGYSNARIDTLTGQIQTELDRERRNALIREALQVARDDVAYIPIFQQMIVWAARDNIDLVQQADNYFPLRHVRVR